MAINPNIIMQAGRGVTPIRRQDPYKEAAFGMQVKSYQAKQNALATAAKEKADKKQAQQVYAELGTVKTPEDYARVRAAQVRIDKDAESSMPPVEAWTPEINEQLRGMVSAKFLSGESMVSGERTDRYRSDQFARDDAKNIEDKRRWEAEHALNTRKAGNSARTAGMGPSNVQEWKYYNALTPADQERYLMMKRAAKVVDLGDRSVVVPPSGDLNAPLSSAEKGVPPAQQPANVSARKTAELEAAKQLKLPKARSSLATFKDSSKRARTKAKALLKRATLLTTGIGSLTSIIPGSPAHDFMKDIGTVKTIVGFRALQEMRDNSPTGGALGNVSEKEGERLEAILASLETSQSKGQIIANLNEVITALDEADKRATTAFNDDFKTALVGKVAPSVSQPSGSAPLSDEDARELAELRARKAARQAGARQ